MRKIIIAALCMLMMLSGTQAEGNAFWTLEKDPYYHLDPACDGGEKVIISEEAALLFGKRSCPLCVDGAQPVYTGGALPEWPYRYDMWEIVWQLDPAEVDAMRLGMPDSYRQAGRNVANAFADIHAEVYDPEIMDMVLTEPYPEDYAGRYYNASGIMSYLMVDPTPESIARFTERYGAGVWIVPAKYSYAEMRQAQNDLWPAIEEWIDAHPESDVHLSGMGITEDQNVLSVGMYGEDWEAAAAQMAEWLPLFVRFEYMGPVTTDSFR